MSQPDPQLQKLLDQIPVELKESPEVKEMSKDVLLKSIHNVIVDNLQDEALSATLATLRTGENDPFDVLATKIPHFEDKLLEEFANLLVERIDIPA